MKRCYNFQARNKTENQTSFTSFWIVLCKFSFNSSICLFFSPKTDISNLGFSTKSEYLTRFHGGLLESEKEHNKYKNINITIIYFLTLGFKILWLEQNYCCTIWWASKSIDLKANCMRKQFDLQQFWWRFTNHQNMKMYRKCWRGNQKSFIEEQTMQWPIKWEKDK